MDNQFSQNLKKLRKEHNLSQEELADELGVSRQSISKWESSVAYPEMDKIIYLCNKFNLNIDDLLNKDIKEVKGEEESKRKINNYISDFFKFITDTVNLFINMRFKSKIKCLFEQVVIGIVLIIISIIIYSVLSSIISSIIGFLPSNIETFMTSIFDSILLLLIIIVDFAIILHIFKVRYLDYYRGVIENKTDKNIENNNDKKTIYEKKEEKIVIRDPKHSEYKFFNFLLKIVVYIIKFFLLCICFGFALFLISLFGALIASFTIAKTGIFFIGILLSILSSATITILFILLILNFVFSRENDKKKMIWSFIISLVVFGMGCGLIMVGSLEFNILDYDKNMIKVETATYEMRDNFYIIGPHSINIEYIESDNNDIKAEYTLNKACDINESTSEDGGIYSYVSCDDPGKVIRLFLKEFNNKKIVRPSFDIESIKIYANKENINKIKENIGKHYSYEQKYNDMVMSYENKILELEDKNRELNEKIQDYEYQLNIQK